MNERMKFKNCTTCTRDASDCDNESVCDENFSRWTDKVVKGVASEEMVVNYNGGRQSKLDYRFDLIDTKAIFALAKVLHTGEVRYGKDNWRKIDTESHLNHAMSHAYAFLAGDQQDDHLSHCFCRLMMAIGVERGDVKNV